MTRRVCAVLACITLAVLGAGCGGGSSGNTQTAPQSAYLRGHKNVTVNAENNRFVPTDLYIDEGTKVTWVNRDTTAHDISKASVGQGFRDGFGAGLAEFGPNKRYSYRFTKPGDLYFYTCTIHGGMSGRVHVFAKPTPTTKS